MKYSFFYILIFLTSFQATLLTESLKQVPDTHAFFGTSRDIVNVTKICSSLQDAWKSGNYPDLASDCSDILSPQSLSVSGGWCIASVSSAGYWRAEMINPVVGIYLHEDSLHIVGNSGGALFLLRILYFSLVETPGKWNYPCYLLHFQYRDACYFHGHLGKISAACAAERFNAVGCAAMATFAGLIVMYGGPLGVASTYVQVMFSFLNDLHLREQSLMDFAYSHSPWNYYVNAPTQLCFSFTNVNPTSSLVFGRGPEWGTRNYGYNSYKPDGMMAYTSDFKPKVDAWYGNMTVMNVAVISANTNSGINLLPFAFVGKNMDSQSASVAYGAGLRMSGMVLSYVMVKKLMLQHGLITSNLPPLCESDGCVLLDGGFSDNAPLTPSLVEGSKASGPLRPSGFGVTGADSTLVTIKFLMGAGPMGIWTFGGLDLCPFVQTEVCTILSKLRTMMVKGLLPLEMADQYSTLTFSFDVFKPQAQVFSPYCADPVIFDIFSAKCASHSVCDLSCVAVPGSYTGLQFTPEVFAFHLCMLSLQSSPLAARFVEQFIPLKVLAQKYYHDMADWFPDFNAVTPQKGGIGFTPNAAHSLMDFLTYLTMRLAPTLVKYRQYAHGKYAGQPAACGLYASESIMGHNMKPLDFVESGTFLVR